MPKLTAKVVLEIEHDNGDYSKYERTATRTYSAAPEAWMDLSAATVERAAQDVRKAIAEDFPPSEF